MLGAIRRYLCLFVLSFFIISILSVSAFAANIVLKVMAANPSKEQVQKVIVKAYLPKEVKPEHVVDKGDLEIAFDNQQGSYYVYGEYELKPGETVEKDIEIRNIWAIEAADIETLRSEADQLTGMLKNTEFSERVSYLKNSIDTKLDQIIESQKVAPANPEKHISNHRENLKALESVKADLLLARNLLSQIKPFPAMMVWKLIFAIIIFLGVIGASFYFIWQKQVKVITNDTFYTPSKKEGKEDGGKSGPEKHETGGEKGLEPTDIENIMKEKKEE
ncbi:MAG: hypothetical protein WC779_03825 [Candidatus Omnitrophota bacterium]